MRVLCNTSKGVESLQITGRLVPLSRRGCLPGAFFDNESLNLITGRRLKSSAGGFLEVGFTKNAGSRLLTEQRATRWDSRAACDYGNRLDEAKPVGARGCSHTSAFHLFHSKQPAGFLHGFGNEIPDAVMSVPQLPTY